MRGPSATTVHGGRLKLQEILGLHVECDVVAPQECNGIAADHHMWAAAVHATHRLWSSPGRHSCQGGVAMRLL